jgi:hypothetical protein
VMITRSSRIEVEGTSPATVVTSVILTGPPVSAAHPLVRLR